MRVHSSNICLSVSFSVGVFTLLTTAVMADTVRSLCTQILKIKFRHYLCKHDFVRVSTTIFSHQSYVKVLHTVCPDHPPATPAQLVNMLHHLIRHRKTVMVSVM